MFGALSDFSFTLTMLLILLSIFLGHKLFQNGLRIALPCILKKSWLFSNFQNWKVWPIFFTFFLHGEMVAKQGNRASMPTNLRVLWQIYNIVSVTYTEWFRYQKNGLALSYIMVTNKMFTHICFVNNIKGTRSVIKFGTNQVEV